MIQIVGAIRLRKEIDNEWMLVASGAVSVLFGAITCCAGCRRARVLFVVGIYAIIYGVMLIGFAFRLRKHAA